VPTTVEFLLKGLVIGFAIAAPVGPIGILCIQRSLRDGFKMGLSTGLGAAFADGVYGLIAAFGLTSISSLLISHQYWIRLIGGLFLIYLGIKIFLSSSFKKSTNVSNMKEKSVLHAWSTTFILTLTNPMTILSFIAVFAGLGLGAQQTNYTHATILVVGIILGSTLWWLLLSGGVAFILYHKLNDKSLQKINWMSGIIMLIFGVLAIKSIF
jgi:threonine/homoserine/homoserine lactone efflux protein